ncbi:SHOCT domain-containing protein [Asaccharospora irregularis]|nr:SHOCT domain-containing protein [Asaccharospora irregularis]
MFINLLLIGIVIYVVFKLSNGSYSIRNGGNEAINILNQRYANSKISEEEYIQKKKMLRE